MFKYITSSPPPIKRLGRLPSSGGMREPRLLDGPEPGASDPLRSGTGLFSRITSITGVLTGALISGMLLS